MRLCHVIMSCDHHVIMSCDLSCSVGIDSSLCCGTHVSNLSDVQSIKLLGTQTRKNSTCTLLYYVAGNRILEYLTRTVQLEKDLNKQLRCVTC